MRYVAFLRATNVGGHTVTMDRLCELFEDMGLRNVETFIVNHFRAVGRELHWHSSGRVTILRLTGPALERKLGAQVTFRSVNTVRRLADRLWKV